MTLSQNIRLQIGQSYTLNQEVKDVLDWIINIGEGTTNESNDGEGLIDILDYILINAQTTQSLQL